MERADWLSLLVGKHVNSGDEAFAGNQSGVALKFKLFGLDAKCQTTELKFERALQHVYGWESDAGELGRCRGQRHHVLPGDCVLRARLPRAKELLHWFDRRPIWVTEWKETDYCTVATGQTLSPYTFLTVEDAKQDLAEWCRLYLPDAVRLVTREPKPPRPRFEDVSNA